MGGCVLSPALERIVHAEAAALLAEFGAGAAVFAMGQIIDAQRSEQPAAVVFWSALLEAVTLPPEPAPAPDPLPAEAGSMAERNDTPARRWPALHRAVLRARQGPRRVRPMRS